MDIYMMTTNDDYDDMMDKKLELLRVCVFSKLRKSCL